MQILLVGYGAMGSALLKGWELFYDITIVDPFKEGCAKSLDELPSSYSPDVIIIAVKPQMLDRVMPAYVKFSHSFFISIAAGVKSERYLEWLNTRIRFCRVMPNLPVSVAQGASAYLLNENCTIDEEKIVCDLFGKVGLVEKLVREDSFDAVTALSGSGPAYVYYICECLERVAVELGLDPEFAQKFARQTIIGAAATLKEASILPAQLRSQVTSKGGTTEAALNVLMGDNSLQLLFSKALKAASDRSRTLATTL